MSANPPVPPGPVAPPSAFEVLRLETELLMREQEFFWQRFYAFATLHAGAFVLMTLQNVPGRAVSGVGFGLGVLWVYVQWASLHYADRWKPSCYSISSGWPKYGMCYDRTGLYASWLGQQKWASSTNAACLVTWLVLAAWTRLFIKFVR